MRSTGPILTAGALTLFNDVIVYNRTWQQDTRVIVGTAVTAAGLGLLEQVAPELAAGLAWLALLTVLMVRVDPQVPAPLESLLNWYQKK